MNLNLSVTPGSASKINDSPALDPPLFDLTRRGRVGVGKFIRARVDRIPLS